MKKLVYGLLILFIAYFGIKYFVIKNQAEKAVGLVRVYYYECEIDDDGNEFYLGFNDEDKIIESSKPNESLRPFTGEATAFLISNKGHLVTNKHVVNNFFERPYDSPIFITRIEFVPNGEPENNGRMASLEVDVKSIREYPSGEDLEYGMKEVADLAILQLKSKNIPSSMDFLTLAEGSNPFKFSPFVCIGFPGGERHNMKKNRLRAKSSVGIQLSEVYFNSYFDDGITYLSDMTHGSSGSPIINLDGEVIAIHSRSGQDNLTEGVRVEYLRQLLRLNEIVLSE